MEAKVLSEAKVYVGTYAKYNNGSLSGAWLDLSDYSDKEEFYEACRELHKDEEDAEYMFQDWENVPEGLIGESWISENFFALRDAVEDFVCIQAVISRQKKRIVEIFTSAIFRLIHLLQCPHHLIGIIGFHYEVCSCVFQHRPWTCYVVERDDFSIYLVSKICVPHISVFFVRSCINAF